MFHVKRASIYHNTKQGGLVSTIQKAKLHGTTLHREKERQFKSFLLPAFFFIKKK